MPAISQLSPHLPRSPSFPSWPLWQLAPALLALVLGVPAGCPVFFLSEIHNSAPLLTSLALVRRCATDPQNHGLWQEFLARFHDRFRSWVVHALSLHMPGPAARFAAMVDDLVQEVYVRLLQDRCRALLAFRGETEESLYCYLRVIAARVTLNYLRARAAKKRIPVQISLEELPEHRRTGITTHGESARLTPETTDDYLRLRELFEHIDHMLDRVLRGRHKHRDKVIFQLYHYEGLTVEEITALPGMRMTPHAVEVVLNRTRNRLARVAPKL